MVPDKNGPATKYWLQGAVENAAASALTSATRPTFPNTAVTYISCYQKAGEFAA